MTQNSIKILLVVYTYPLYLTPGHRVKTDCYSIMQFFFFFYMQVCIHTPVFVCTLCHTPWRRKPLWPLPPCFPLSLIPFPAVKICFPLPESHMWRTLMCCIFNPTDLHFQKFPLPAQAWNEAQTQNVAVSTVPSAWAFVLIFFFFSISLPFISANLFSPSFSIQKIAVVAPGCWYLRFTNSNFLDELV